jgi:hypothetical protein
MAHIKQGPSDSWWADLLGALLLFGGAVWLYYDLTAFETEGGERRMQWVLVLLYNYLGKWGIVGFFALAGVGLTFHGLSQLRAALAEAEAARARRKRNKPADSTGLAD